MVASPPPAPRIAPAQPPSYGEATANSTATWQEDLQALFNHAKDRFADVVWDLADEKSGKKEEIWGHKGMLLVLLCCFYLVLEPTTFRM